MPKFFKLVRRHPETGELVDTYSGTVTYSIGQTVEDKTPHGLSVHSTASRALTHGVPATSVGRDWTAVLLRVSVANDDIILRGTASKKTLVRRLVVERVERDNIHPDIAQQDMSPYRMADAESWLAKGWGGFREVGMVTRGAPRPNAIATDHRAEYVIECRPASSGRYSKPVDYRAVRRG
jgi:hypothetical protein